LKRNDLLELRRQTAHSLSIFLIPIVGLIGTSASAVALAVALVLLTALAYFRKFREKYRELSRVEEWFEDVMYDYERRKEREAFPLQGPITLTLGILVALLVFPQHAMPAIAVLAIADAVSTVVGKFYGRHRLPINGKKSWEGSIAFFVSAVFVLMFFAGTREALLVAGIAAVVEGLPDLDDNITIPLAVAALMSFI